MLALINELTDVPDWNRQIFDPEFTLKWRNEKNLSGEDVTRSMAEWVSARWTLTQVVQFS